MLKRIFFSLVLILFLLPMHLPACSVPVFRYSLERWQPNPYTVRVFYQGKFDKDQQAAIDLLKKTSEKNCPINLEIIDIDQEIPPNAKPVLKRYKDKKLPFVVVNYHLYSRIPNDADFFPLSLKNVEELINSPARKELARRLLKGDSAVFIQVDGEDEKENKQVAEKVTKILREMEKELKLPHEMLAEGEELDEEAMQYDPNIKIKFSLQRISRNDPKEKRFLNLLLNCEKDLPGRKTPLIMSVFGRGRALFAFLGKGITKANLKDAGEFISGPCSCEVKAQNPGFDLLMNIPWDDLVNDTIRIDDALPPLTGLTTAVKKEKPVVPVDEINLKSAAKVNERPEEQKLPISIFLTLSGIVILVYILLKFFGRK